LKQGQEVDEAFIAARRYDLKLKLFMYRRKKARWLTLYDSVIQSSLIPDLGEEDFDDTL